MAIARSHRPGHIGHTPQNTDTIVAGGRVTGMHADFGEHFQPPDTGRIFGFMGRPAVSADPGYFRDDWTGAQIVGSTTQQQLSGRRQFQSPKTLGGYDPLMADA